MKRAQNGRILHNSQAKAPDFFCFVHIGFKSYQRNSYINGLVWTSTFCDIVFAQIGISRSTLISTTRLDSHKSKKDSLKPKSPSLISVEILPSKPTEDQSKSDPVKKDTKSRKRKVIKVDLVKPKIKALIITTAIFAAIITMVIYYATREEDKTQTYLWNTIENTTTANFNCFTFKGDGFCDDEANDEFCDFDGGDCCDTKSDRSQCTECFCKIEYFQTKDYIDCSKVPKITSNGGLSFAKHGDGNCDEELNNAEQFLTMVSNTELCSKGLKKET